jgi:hypothetical protein
MIVFWIEYMTRLIYFIINLLRNPDHDYVWQLLLMKTWLLVTSKLLQSITVSHYHIITGGRDI